jgi:hypothetical protein
VLVSVTARPVFSGASRPLAAYRHSRFVRRSLASHVIRYSAVAVTTTFISACVVASARLLICIAVTRVFATVAAASSSSVLSRRVKHHTEMTKRRGGGGRGGQYSHRRVQSKGLAKMFDDFFDYETPKQVHVNSKFVGFLNRLIQLGIVTYIGG